MAPKPVSKKAETKAVTLVTPNFDDELLRSLHTTDDVMSLMRETYGTVDSISDYELGNGFHIMREEDKRRLVGESFLVLLSSYHMGEYSEFVSLFLFVPRTNERLILNDGGQGIPQQIRELQTQSQRAGGWAVPRGLRVSDYPTCAECGRPRPKESACEACQDDSDRRSKGTTFYLEVAA